MSNKQIEEIVAVATRLNAEAGKRRRDLVHVDNRLGAGRYVREAEEISRQMKPGSSVLDLGCGAGQVAYLLANNGLTVTASEIFDAIPPYVEHYNRTKGREPIEYVPADILKSEEHALNGRVFDAIVIYGVLEHVPDFALFLERCKAMLNTHGKLYIYQFPNRWSWREKVGDWMGNSSHELRFAPDELGMMLRWHGFQILDFGYEQILPLNLTSLPAALSRIYYGLSPWVLMLDRILRFIPLLNRLSTSYWFKCRKARAKS
jgi:2-polyprenyl-3-methyl-5-hydroxy-6-metoxy-1,4-benzoquinol methylase